MNKEQAKHSARAFRAAAKRCMEPRPASGGQVEEVLAVPGIVNAAFSAELGMKALLLASGKQVKGHDLQQLFNQLDGSMKKKIISTVGQPENDFFTALNAVRNVFDEWRYVHEKGALHVSPQFLDALAGAVEGVLNT